MRHLQSGRKLGVTAPHRRALLRSLTIALIEKESIQTTPARAKEMRRMAEKVVTLSKRGDLSATRRILQILGTTRTQKVGENRIRNVIEKLKTDLAPRFKTRPGGYTQLFHTGRRAGDNAAMCILRFIPGEEKKAGPKDKSAKPAKKDKAKEAKSADAAAKKAADKPGNEKKVTAAPKSPVDKALASKGKKASSGHQDRPAKKKG